MIPLLLVSLLGCKKVDPAPEDLNGLVHFMWDELEEGDDEVLVEAMTNLHAAIDGDDLEELLEGVVTDLSESQIADLRPDADPSEATGVFIADPIDCTLSELEAILAHEDQDELYTGVYDEYDRTTTGDKDAFLDGDIDELTWDLEYTSSLLGVQFTVDSQTVVRRVSEVEMPDGPALVLRAHMVDEAEFTKEDSNNHLKQDYHLEMYWPDGDRLLHVYALWKDTKMLGFDDEQEGTQRLILNNLADWDEGTSKLCQEGLP